MIPGTRTRIPAGTDLVIPVWSIHHDWRFYPNPEVFDPSRFMGDEKHSRPSGTYLSFGDGPRFCIGELHTRNYKNCVISANIDSKKGPICGLIEQI